MKKEAKKRVDIWDFSGGPMTKRAPNAGGPGSIPGQGTRSLQLKIMHAARTPSAVKYLYIWLNKT